MKTQLSLGSIIAAGLLASGCSQMSGQAAQATPEVVAPAPEVRTVVDCSKCAPAVKPRPAVRPRPVAKRPPAPVRRAPPPVRRAPPVVRRAPAVNRWVHSHPAIPGCTNSITHSHPYTDRNHTHRYSCRQGQRQQPVVQRQQVRPAVNRWTHSHPAIPGCTNSITHSHPYTNANHSHRYSCRQGQRQQPVSQYRPPAMPVMPMPVMPKVKAKGTYRGPIQIDGGVMQQYQQ